jgi:hypothetical protein
MTNDLPDFPDLIPADIELVGLDGNAFAIIGAITGALRKAGNTPETIAAVRDSMMDGDYNHLLRVAMVAVGDL